MTLRDFARAVRTRQWAKNALLFGGFIFAGRLRAPDGHAIFLAELLRIWLAFGCFCALSGAAYLLNDWMDIERDRAHPVKRNRPLAAGRISPGGALAIFVGLLMVAALLALAIALRDPAARWFGVAGAAYFALTVSYSLRLKHEVVIDVLAVALGFVVRVVAGCLAIPVIISPWILFCTFNLALFVALCKRRAELLEVGRDGATRGVLKGYTAEMLDTFISVAAGLTIISYSLYTFQAPLLKPLGSLAQTPLMMTSIPFVIYGVFRYLLLAHSSSVGGEPEQMLRDKPLLINGILWALWVAFLTVLPTLG